MKIFRKASVFSFILDPYTSEFFWSHPKLSTALYTLWGMTLGFVAAAILGIGFLVLLIRML